MGITKQMMMEQMEAEQEAKEGNVGLLLALLEDSKRRETSLVRYIVERGLYEDYTKWRVQEAVDGRA